MKLPGVTKAHADVVCCTDGLPVVFIGIEEKNAPVLHVRPAPIGSIRLPPDILRTGAEFEELWTKAVSSGHSEEDDSEGHMLLLEAAARPTEDRMMAIADSDLTLLRNVLRESSDSHHRALAAQLLGYQRNMQSVVPDLVYAMKDPSPDVRNNAMRALGVFKRATKVPPPRVPYEPFIALLDSPVWSDRNKASLILMELAATRDPQLLAMLRGEALPVLLEMARWSDRSHAWFAFCILGNLAGIDEQQVSDDFWVRNDRDRVIKAAMLRPKF